MSTTNSDDFNVIQFEKRLTALKDSQDHINACCRWCLDNRQHHKKIVNSWLNVLKRVKIEQRVNLFYLANDVIQYSKRKNYEFVDSWGTALQKATTLVRDDKVKHKIVRIFNIWQQRNVYNEEFISDLCGLISVVPTASKNDEPHEFQANYVINKIKHCSKLENETDLKLKVLKEHNPKIQLETESLCTSLKDRAHVDDVEKELETYVKHLEGYINALKAEIKCRINNISVLKQANIHLEKDKRDVKVVATAYKTFGARIKTFQKKLEEHRATLISPIPSPDINAPSPSPDSDLELPDDDDDGNKTNNVLTTYDPASTFTAGYYNPVPPPTTETNPNFVTNGYTSFIGSNFSVPSSLFTNTQTTAAGSTNLNEVTNINNQLLQSLSHHQQPPPPPVETSAVIEATEQNFSYDHHNHHHHQQQQQSNNSGHMPLLPPPMPPFSTNDQNYNPYNSADNKSNFGMSTDTFNSSVYDPSFDANLNETYNNNSSYHHPTQSMNDYNPEQETDNDNWKTSWSQSTTIGSGNTTDTPESPPIFEKEGGFNSQTVEYHDNVNNTGAVDVDHRVLRHAIPPSDNVRSSRGKDVDHRNLISLTGSPGSDTQTNNTTIWNNNNNNNQDQDYRTSTGDHDYRLLPSSFNIEQLKLPPPPPPVASTSTIKKQSSSSPRKITDSNVESIDMELSEDENDLIADNVSQQQQQKQDNLRVLVGNDITLKPPPPLPDLPDDVDANNFLDGLNNDLNSQDFAMNLAEIQGGDQRRHHHQQQQQQMVGQHHYTPSGVQQPLPPIPPPLPPPQQQHHPEIYLDSNSGCASGDGIISNNHWPQQQSNFIIRNNDNRGGFNNIRNHHHHQRGRGRTFGFNHTNNNRVGGNNRGRGGFGIRSHGQIRHRHRGNMRGGNFH